MDMEQKKQIEKFEQDYNAILPTRVLPALKIRLHCGK